MRTNVAYDGTIDDDSPVHGSAVSFNVKDFLHIKVITFEFFKLRSIPILIKDNDRRIISSKVNVLLFF